MYCWQMYNEVQELNLQMEQLLAQHNVLREDLNEARREETQVMRNISGVEGGWDNRGVISLCVCLLGSCTVAFMLISYESSSSTHKPPPSGPFFS